MIKGIKKWIFRRHKDKWHHYAITYEKSPVVIRHYMDGDLVDPDCIPFMKFEYLRERDSFTITYWAKT